ncbi:MAG: DNA alkylation repair protein [gamma proteobacterium symbiont of Ctena orbiculata]|nr:MAG: DNA alkylation repair protein [gamma proteobacterium symbiont of Ctena orbiculata]
MDARQLHQRLRGLGDPTIAEHSQRFFKTAKGEYAEGDRFLGIRVPVLRQQAGEYLHMPIKQLLRSLRSVYHEERLCAVLIMVLKYQRGSDVEREAIFQHYLSNTQYINNWDLVDSSAYHILGPHLEYGDRHPLYRLARSDSIWERRMAIISTLYFIKKQQYEDTLKISLELLSDPHDLIHKAVGWMLREVGNRDLNAEQTFLARHYQKMPRTMLRYAIEKFPEKQRKAYLQGRV